VKLSWCGGNPILCCDTKNAAPSNVVAQSSKAVALSWALLPLPPGLTPTEEQAIAEGALGTAEGSRARGAAALALAAGATAYVLTRRREREAEHEAELDRKRKQAAEWAAKATALKARVEANRRAAHSAAAVVAAAAAAVTHVARRRADPRGLAPWHQPG
jgi:hypothetical protein